MIGEAATAISLTACARALFLCRILLFEFGRKHFWERQASRKGRNPKAATE